MTLTTAADVSAVYDTLTERQTSVIDSFTNWKSIRDYHLRAEFTAAPGYKRSYVSWSYDTPSGTISVIEALTKKGFFTVTERVHKARTEQVYTLTPAALEFFTAKRDALQAERAERDRVRNEQARTQQAKARAVREATAALLEKYNDEFTALRDALEAKYLEV